MIAFVLIFAAIGGFIGFVVSLIASSTSVSVITSEVCAMYVTVSGIIGAVIGYIIAKHKQKIREKEQEEKILWHDNKTKEQLERTQNWNAEKYKARVNDPEYQKNKHHKKEDVPLTCPHCGSKQISAHKKGISFWMGAIGSQKVYITCLKCGHRWLAGHRW